MKISILFPSPLTDRGKYSLDDIQKKLFAYTTHIFF